MWNPSMIQCQLMHVHSLSKFRINVRIESNFLRNRMNQAHFSPESNVSSGVFSEKDENRK
jgi:hypothetical protein